VRLERIHGVCVATMIWLVASVMPARAAVNCFWGVATGVNFGNYDVFSGATTTSNGSISFRCVGIGSGTANVSVDLSTGNAPTYAPRYMLSGAQRLNYNLYIDPFGFFIWGDGTGGTLEYGPFGVSNNQTVTLTVYGQIPAGQDLPAGTYNDTITATVNF
jgi:spore coat protein U domain-containing protein, fimbrial subunit CupE1/2/3/6